MSALVAGGGLKMGQALGSTSARGEYPKDRPITVPQLLSTVYRAMGIDPSMTFPNGKELIMGEESFSPTIKMVSTLPRGVIFRTQRDIEAPQAPDSRAPLPV